MLTPLLSLLLAVPFAPAPLSPAPEGWTRGEGGQFHVSAYGDDAGVPALSVRLEFRAEDAGYGMMDETFPYDRYLTTRLQFPVEGVRFCWRARFINTMNQVSEPGAERCFRIDFTSPVSGAVDAGAIASDGFVAVDLQPATDALSGVRGYFLYLAPATSGPFHGFGDDVQLPLETYVGEGNWLGWVRATDNAGNTNESQLGSPAVPITITASPAVPVPEAPRFESTITSRYGEALRWDAGWMADAGVTHVVSSFCKVDAGCVWLHGFHGVPVTDRQWQQLQSEGPMIARIAVVQGGQVGAWSAPSEPLLVDRTEPTIPGQTSSTPAAARMGPFTVSWGASTDDFTGLSHYLVRRKEQRSGETVITQVAPPTVMTSVSPSADGRYELSVAAVDLAGNQSEFTAPDLSVLDHLGPTSQRPTATGVGIGSTTFVTITWQLPVDALSDVTTLELLESSQDGGAQLVSVTGLSTSRMVPAGEWRWQLRGTDSLGNVGLFSQASNTVLVTVGGIVNGPSITTTEIAARCGEPLSVELQGAGTAPLIWSLVSGPSGLSVGSGGIVTWTPPAGSSGTELVRVKASNAAGFVNGEVQLQVSCDEPSPVVDGGVAQQKSLIVGCGCTSFDPLALFLALAILVRRKVR